MSPSLKLKVISKRTNNINNNNNHNNGDSGSSRGDIHRIGKSNNFKLAQREQSNTAAKNENDEHEKQKFVSSSLSPIERRYIRKKRSALDLINETQNPNQNLALTTTNSTSAGTTKRKVRKFFIRRKPHLQNNTDTSEQSLPKTNPRRRVVILKHKLNRSVNLTSSRSDDNLTSSRSDNNLTSSRSVNLTSNRSDINLASTRSDDKLTSSWPDNMTTSSQNITPTTTAETAPSNKRCKNRSQQSTSCQRRRNRKSKSKKLQSHPVIASSSTSTTAVAIATTYTDILTHYETMAIISLETTLRPRTYTYVIDRVHDDQHEIQTSMLVRDHLTTLTHTLTVTKAITSTTLRLVTPTLT